MLKHVALVSVALLSSLASSACGSAPKGTGKYPMRAPGCEVQVFPEEPSYPTDNIGTVRATCDESLSDAECMRELQDQACKLGADSVWGVDAIPKRHGNKKTLSGRAAHQK